MCDLSKFKWHCRRGMLELDLILNQFLECYFFKLTESEKSVFQELLNYSDPEIYQWLMGVSDPQDAKISVIVKLIKQHGRFSATPLTTLL